jgi:polar amino acid transport system substrate-binding protein
VTNHDIVKYYANDLELLNAINANEIDCFLTDRVAGSAMIVQKKMYSKIIEKDLEIKVPVHVMFSKKTVPENIVQDFNKHINSIKDSAEYNNIIREHLYPVLFLKIIDSKLFWLINILGTTAFVMVAIGIAIKCNTTLFGTMVCALLPSFIGNLAINILVYDGQSSIFLGTIYVYVCVGFVLIAFFLTRILSFYNNHTRDDSFITKLSDAVIVVFDIIGQSSFAIIGVFIAVISRVEPLILWGTIIAFIVSCVGCVLRDALLRSQDNNLLFGRFGLELNLLTGFIMTKGIEGQSLDPSEYKIYTLMLVCLLLSVTVRIVLRYTGVTNLHFFAR